MTLTHYAGGFRGLGGVEAIVKEHWKRDRDFGIESRFLIFYEGTTPPIDRVSFLNINEASTIRGVRRSVRSAIGSQENDIAVYHNLWGLRQHCDLDLAKRRVFLLHGYGPSIEEQVKELNPFADGILCVSRPLEKQVREWAPSVAGERIDYIAIPIFPPKRGVTQRALEGRPLVIGFCGRIIIEQKRVDRVPAFLEALKNVGLDYRMEFLGEGPEMPALKEVARGNPRVVIHGRQSGDEYWKILRNWDVLISFSDYEGTPLSMLEAMSQGVIPIMPRMNSGGDETAAELNREFVYEQDDFKTVAEIFLRLAKLPESKIGSMRSRAVQLVATHSIESYLATFQQFTKRIHALPRVSRKNPPPRPFPLNVLSYRSLDRLGKIVRRVKRM